MRARLCHGSQKPLTPRIDKRDLIEIDNACSSTLVAVRFFPTGSQLGNPRPDQPALQNPSLFRRRLVDGDLQHVYLSCPPNGFGRVPLATGPCLAVSIEQLEFFLVPVRRLPHGTLLALTGSPGEDGFGFIRHPGFDLEEIACLSPGKLRSQI